jgi:Na+/H+ antiporter NhaD/arsenite permease-like protein
MPSLIFGLPFAALVLAIAIFPLLPHNFAAWWEHNRNKLLVSIFLSLIVLAWYFLRAGGYAGHGEKVEPGLATLKHVLHLSILEDYVPFMILLFSLYTIRGGIRVAGDIPAHPITNTVILAIGAVLANLIGTTGASMLLIRPLLQINSERHHTKHTVIFFIFIVSNVAGSLTPIGDPPLFLGYLRGVPFGWTAAKMWPITLTAVGALLLIYLIWETIEYGRETKKTFRPTKPPSCRSPSAAAQSDPADRRGVDGCVGDSRAALLGTDWQPKPYVREAILLALAAIGYATTRAKIRQANQFNFGAIAEVAALFLGIFVTMTALTEWLTIPASRLSGHGNISGRLVRFQASSTTRQHTPYFSSWRNIRPK